MKTEIAIGSTLKEVEKFDKTNMKNVDVQEKNPLPDKEGMLFLLRKGLDTVESLSVEVKGSKVANFTVLVTLLPTFVTYICHF